MIKKTYPIFEATFGGSEDYMAQPTISLAAVNIHQAVKKFREWDQCNTGTCGRVGRLIYRSDEHGWVRPDRVTAAYIKRNTDLRALRLGWYSVSPY